MARSRSVSMTARLASSSCVSTAGSTAAAVRRATSTTTTAASTRTTRTNATFMPEIVTAGWDRNVRGLRLRARSPRQRASSGWVVGPDRAPRLRGDPQGHRGDLQAGEGDPRSRRSKRDGGGRQDDAERDEPVRAGVMHRTPPTPNCAARLPARNRICGLLRSRSRRIRPRRPARAHRGGRAPPDARDGRSPRRPRRRPTRRSSRRPRRPPSAPPPAAGQERDAERQHG